MENRRIKLSFLRSIMIVNLISFILFYHVFDVKSQNSDVLKEIYSDFNHGQHDKTSDEWVQSIKVIYPSCRSNVEGYVTVKFVAPGMEQANAYCWQQPTFDKPSEWGHDANLTPEIIKIRKNRESSFTFNADEFPSGPMNIRIYAQNRKGEKDVFELQLYNTGGVKWNTGIPDKNPPAAKGLKLLFSDDFDTPPSISNDGRNARYSAHKPRFGDFSGWQFADVTGENNPFAQVDSYLKIKARKKEAMKGSSGLIASVDMDGKGFWAKAPCYLECRFTAQSAPGTWPAFWTITHLDQGEAGDELDIVEAYGGVGKGNPNHEGYSIVSHFWGQNNSDGTKREHPSKVVLMMDINGKSYWSTTFHTYGLYIGLEETIYYLDDTEVFRHITNNISRDYPHAFLINYAIGGISGWPIDLERYGNGSDMYVDFVRVYGLYNVDYVQERKYAKSE